MSYLRNLCLIQDHKGFLEVLVSGNIFRSLILFELLFAVQETQVLSLSQEDPLEKGMATQSNILAWRIPVDRGAW